MRRLSIVLASSLILPALALTSHASLSAADALSSPGGRLYTSADDARQPLARESRELRSEFVIEGPHSVPYQLFSVCVPGPIRIELRWEGRSTDLTLALTGRRRPGVREPMAPYAVVTGRSPLMLSYEVTEKDLVRGVGWRVGISGAGRTADAKGTVRISVPFDAKRDAVFQREKIALRSGDLWPSAALQARFVRDLAATDAGGLHAIISLERALTCVEARELERLGLVRQSFLPGRRSFGYVSRDVNLGHPLIAQVLRGLTPLEPEDKVDPDVLLGNYQRFVVTPAGESTQNYVLNADGTLELSILFAKDTPVHRIQTILTTEALSSSAITDNLWRSTLAPDKLALLAAYDEVEWIGAGPVPPLIVNDTTRQNLHVDAVQNPTIDVGAGTIAYGGLTGAGITVGVVDKGVDATHNDLNVVADLAGVDCHGTHVAGIIAASGIQSSGSQTDGDSNGGTPFQWRGMAPNATIVDSDDLINAANLLDAIQNSSLDVTNRSLVLDLDGNYHAAARTVDQETRGGTVSGGTTLPRRPWTHPSCNNGDSAKYTPLTGYFSLLNQTKNPILVGAWDAHNNLLTGFSSMGPTHDGRVKPDVVAPGLWVRSTGTASNEMQSVWFGGAHPTQGSFTLTYSGQTTASIAYNASATTVQSRLEALSNISPGDVSATGGDLPGNAIVVEFVGTLARTDVPKMTTADTGLDAGVSSVVLTQHEGNDDRNGYVVMSGTSMASPAVAGVVAQLLEGWQTTYSTPLGTTIDANAPLPSTLRAILIETAEDIVDSNVRGVGVTCADVDSDSNETNGNDGAGQVTATLGPDFATGWGLVNAQAAANLLQDSRVVGSNVVANRIIQGAVNQNVVKEYDFVVAQTGELRVTLAWDDLEAAVQSPATSPRLVNDLDLELEDPNGTILYPWQLGQTIQDQNGNALADNAQPPGTNIQVQIPISPSANPWLSDYVPANALTGSGDWVAAQGKDHLNNVEQVFVANVQPNQIGHWTLRVLGFDVRSGPQDYSVVGFPYPDLAELVVSCSSKVGLSALNTPMTFTWTVENVGALGTGGPGDTFDYKVWLSKDFYVDSTDVELTDANQALLGPLAPGASLQQTSSVQITQTNVDALLGSTPGTGTIQQLLDADVFLLVQVDVSDVVLEHNETNVTFVQLARLADVVLVMDRSGSMGGSVPVSDGTQSKIDILEDSVNLFLDLIRVGAGDELSEVSFSSTVTTDFGPSGLTSITAGSIGQARTAVNALTHGGLTNIRAALQRGLDVLKAGTGTGHQRVLIFFSDGQRTAGGDPTAAAFLQQFDTEDVRVYSAGFGTEGSTGSTGIDVDLLQTLADANPGDAGFFHVTESALALDKFFVNAVAGAIDSQVVVDPEEDILGGRTHSVDLWLGQEDLAVTFVLAWDNPSLNLDLSVRAPSGLEISAANAGGFGDAIALRNAPAYKLIKVQLPIAAGPSEDHDGRWQMLIGNPGHATVHYAASAIVESTIRAEAGLAVPAAHARVSVGDHINLLAEVRGMGGIPICGAAVTVTPNVPLVGLGEILSSAKVTKAELAAVPRELNGEPLSARERLYLAAQRRLGRRDLLRRADRQPFELTELREPGEYVGTFPEAGIEGVYNFNVRIDGLTTDCQPFQRELSLSVLVSPDADPRDSGIVIDWGDPGRSVTVTVTPKTSVGTLVGPGLASGILMRPSESLESTSGVDDNLDGSYSQTFRIVRRGAAAVDVSIGRIQLPRVVVPCVPVKRQ